MTDANTVDTAIPVAACVAAALDDEAARDFVGRVVSRMLRPASADALERAIRALKREAHEKGLTDDMIDEELAACNAERPHAEH